MVKLALPRRRCTGIPRLQMSLSNVVASSPDNGNWSMLVVHKSPVPARLEGWRTRPEHPHVVVDAARGRTAVDQTRNCPKPDQYRDQCAPLVPYDWPSFLQHRTLAYLRQHQKRRTPRLISVRQKTLVLTTLLVSYHPSPSLCPTCCLARTRSFRGQHRRCTWLPCSRIDLAVRRVPLRVGAERRRHSQHSSTRQLSAGNH
jgi:hypothetical protein